MKMNKKITSAVLALAMITSSFSGILPIGGSISAGAAYDASMNGLNDYIYRPGTNTTDGWTTDLTITQEVAPGTVTVRVTGKANPILFAGGQGDNILLEVTEMGNTNNGSQTSIVLGSNDTGSTDTTLNMYFHDSGPNAGEFSGAVNAGAIASFSGENTFKVRAYAELGTPAHSATLLFNVKDGVLQVPVPKAPVTVSEKTGLNADIIASNGQINVNQLINVNTTGTYNGALSLVGTQNLPTGVTLNGTTGLNIATTVSLPVTLPLTVSAPATVTHAAVPAQTINVTIVKGTQAVNLPLDNKGIKTQGGTFTLPAYESTKKNNFGTRGTPTYSNTQIKSGTIAGVTLNGSVLTWTPGGGGTITIDLDIGADNFYNAIPKATVTIEVVSLPAQDVKITAPVDVFYDGANITTAVTAVATTTGGVITAPGAVSYAITSGGTIATIDATTGVVTWTGYGAITVEATAAETLQSAETKATHTITRKKADLTVNSKNSKVGKTGPANIDAIVSSSVKLGDTLDALNAYDVTYKLTTDAAPEAPLDFTAPKDLAFGEYSFTVTPKAAETTNYLTAAGTTGKFIVAAPSSSDDDVYFTVFYDVGSNGSITSGASNEQVTQGGKAKHVPTVKGTTGFEHSGWSLDGKSVDPTSVTINSNTTFKAVYNGEVVKPEIPSDLAFDKELTSSYIKGDTEGTFRPDDSITRAEFATIISRSLNKKMDDAQSSDTNFNDVSSSDWYAKAIAFVQSMGLINGYEDGTFRPEASITRAEAAVIIMRVEKIQGDVVTGTLTDISGNWAEKEILAAYAKGLISGYPDGTFRPENRITRAETVTMLNNVLDIKPIEASDVFTDINGHWAASQITAAATIGSNK